jgi:hypothetical protein
MFTHAGEGEVIPVGRESEISNGQIGVDDGDMQLFVFTPAANWYIQAVYIDGALNSGAAISGSYFFNNIHESHTVHVIFAKTTVNIFASAGTNGTITPAGNVVVPYDECQNFVIKANTGYVIDKVFIDNNPIEVEYEASQMTYTFCNVTEPHTIYVTFKVATLEIHVSWTDCDNSALAPAGAEGIVYVPYNAIQIITFLPDVGCEVVEVIIDGVSYPNAISTGSYTFYYVKENRSIHVVFAKKQNPIISAINNYGVITPNGKTLVNYGADQKYTWYTFPGFEVKNVFIDGLDNLDAVADGEYTFTDVKVPHTIDVIAGPIVLNISASAIGGIITPSGDIPVVYGENQLFTFKAPQGIEIETVLIDGIVNSEAATNGAYSFVNVKENHTIEVIFKTSKYYVEAKSNGSGTIEPAGITEITYFDVITYTITPDDGYQISYVLVNGNNMGAIDSYMFIEADSDGNIEVFFSPTGEDNIDIYDLGISIYSNTNIVYLYNKNLVPIKDVSIFDMYGRVVWQGSVYEIRNAIPLNVAAGIYSVRVITADDNTTTTKVPILR